MSVDASVGSHPLSGTANLPNVTVSFPGSHWSNAVASGRAITPGECVLPTSSGGILAVRPVTVADDENDPRVAIALQCVLAPEAEHPRAFGPTELVNQDIPVGEYVHRYVSGSFVLTLVDPTRSYAPGDLIGWDIDGTRPDGKDGGTGVGAWAPEANSDIAVKFEIQLIRQTSNGDFILNVRDPWRCC